MSARSDILQSLPPPRSPSVPSSPTPTAHAPPSLFPPPPPSLRAGLRTIIEQNGLNINREFLDASGKAQEALAVVDGQLERLLESCKRIASALDDSRERSGALIRETAKLNADLESVEEKKRTVATFLVDYQLADDEIAALQRDAVDDAFFDALARVQEIHSNCRRLLRTHHQRAGLELMDVMAGYQETAHERLCRWVQAESRALAEEDGEDAPELLSRAMAALRARPTLHRYCVEEVSRTRHNALFRRFITALTRGGPGGVPRPIESHASDPRRYVGDMLGWLHQAAAGEKELVAALLGGASADGALPDPAAEARDDGEARAKEAARDDAGDEDDETADPATVLDRILDGVCRPFKVRVEQALTANPGALVCHKLANLLAFYERTLSDVAGPDAALTATVEECRASAKAAFEAETTRRAAALRKMSAVPPDALTPPGFVAEGARQAVELLESEDGLTEGADAETTASVSAVIDPVVAACERGAEMIAEMIDAHAAAVATTGAELSAPPAAHRARWAKEAYLFNCLDALRRPLRAFPAVASLTESLDERAEALRSKIADDEAGRVLSRVGVAEVRELVSLYQGQRAAPGAMRRDPALALAVVGGALDALVDAMGATTEPVPAFDEVQNPRARAEIRREFAGKIIEAYTLVYAAVLDPSNGYGDAKAAMRHGPNALSTLLGGV